MFSTGYVLSTQTHFNTESNMNRLMKVFSVILVAAFGLAACAPAATIAPTAMPVPTEMPAPTNVPTATPTAMPKAMDIVDTAVADGHFKTLVAAVQAAGLVDTLKGAGPFSVFAPTDDAFAKLPAGTIDTLLKPENKQKLTDILLYHVVSGKVMAADVVKLMSAKTVEGKDVAIKVDMGNVYINNAKVIITDIQTSNGVIHVIDTVLLPPQ
jgi:transforming growth factor-beta-induced protein